MKIELLAIGKIKENGLSQLESEYLKRLKPYIVSKKELPDRKEHDQNKRLKKESQLIQKQMCPSDCWVLLDEKGTSFTSVQFSRWIGEKRDTGVKKLGFVIGSAYGLDESLKQKFRFSIKLSDMTLTHELCRILFLEQLYRAFTIIENKPYHH